MVALLFSSSYSCCAYCASSSLVIEVSFILFSLSVSLHPDADLLYRSFCKVRDQLWRTFSKISPIRSFLLNIFPDVLCFFGSSYIMFHIEYDLRQDKHLTDTPLHFSIRKKEVNVMTCDETLYRQYLSGDDEGLNALMKKYGDPLTLYIDGYLHDVHEAEELMLDVFAYLFTKKPKIRDGGFKAYLYKAARHMALRHKSKRKPLFSLDALADEPDGRLLAEEVIRTEERNRILHFCMSEMNPDYREVLYLTYFEGMSYAQAAEVTGKTVKQITNRVYRGKESLRRLLEREGITNAES